MREKERERESHSNEPTKRQVSVENNLAKLASLVCAVYKVQNWKHLTEWSGVDN